MNATTACREALRHVVARHPWVVALDVLASATPLVETLFSLGAPRVMALGAYRGTGPLPDPSRVPTACLDLPPADLMTSLRAADAALSELPPELRAAVDRFDPTHEARVVGTIFSSGRPVADRPVWGARPSDWQSLEDKTTVDALWDAAGIRRAPSRVVPVEGLPFETALQRLAEAATALDRGDGTVWAVDNRQGFHGAAQGLRWVREPYGPEGERACRFVLDRAHRVRVMPFLEGIPCSIHGWVFDTPFLDETGATTHTLSFRPCEMVVLRAPSQGTFIYAQAATFWDPPELDRIAMRALARRVGDCLHATVGYRGVFTVDGVLSAEGFLPTELNPRFGAALAVLGRSLPELPLYLLHLATVEGELQGVDPLSLERTVLAHADAQRQGGCARVLEVGTSTERTGRLYETPKGYALNDEETPAPEGGIPVGTVRLGPHASGTFLQVSFDPTRVPKGPSVAPRVVEALRAIERAWRLPMGEMEVPVDVRAKGASLRP
jgi:hypothetical protein